MQAVKSVLSQSLSRNLYEIIVVKNFADRKIDQYLEDNSVKNILEFSPYWNKTLSRALNEAEGKIISFLDDDDFFNTIKLETILELFGTGDIAFCKDGTIPVSDESQPLDFYKERSRKNSTFYLDKNGIYHGDSSYLSLFNSSSMSISEKALREHLQKLNQNLSGDEGCRYAMDNFICFSGLESGKCFVTPEKLTYYRHHRQQLTLNRQTYEDFDKKKADLENSHNFSYKYMRRAFVSGPILVKLDSMSIQSELQEAIIKRKEKPFLLTFIRKALFDFFKSHEIFVLLLMFLYLLSFFSTKASSWTYKYIILHVSRQLN